MTEASTTPPDRYVIGVDFGTLSARAVVVRACDGSELASGVADYGHGVIDTALPGAAWPLPHDWALQDPSDWWAAMRTAVRAAVSDAAVDPQAVIGIGTDFTACTVMPTLSNGTPLCWLPELADEPHAWPKLWKHHAAQAQADRITALAHERGEAWIDRYGGRISSEWQFAKALQVLDEAPEVYDRIERWIEAADWIVWKLCGVETRNACTAGYKGMYQEDRYPTRDYLAALDPRFADFAETRLSTVEPSPLGARAGHLTESAAGWLGLPSGIAIATGNVDAHVTASAAHALGSGRMLAIMGTSTCHVMSSEKLSAVPGMCGVVDGGIVAGSYGYEAGQSAVGDIFAWWIANGVPGEYADAADRAGQSLHEYLAARAADQPIGGHGLIALDWLGGNRSVLVDHHLSGVIAGLTLTTKPEDIYRALMEATAYGTRTIVDAFVAAGVPVNDFVVAGGLKRNRVLMQIYADVLRRPVAIAASDQAPALGSAIHAAVAAGAWTDVPAAAAAMGRLEPDVYQPDPHRADAYDDLYQDYHTLHDYFSGRGDGTNDVLHRLRRRRNGGPVG